MAFARERERAIPPWICAACLTSRPAKGHKFVLRCAQRLLHRRRGSKVSCVYSARLMYTSSLLGLFGLMMMNLYPPPTLPLSFSYATRKSSLVKSNLISVVSSRARINKRCIKKRGRSRVWNANFLGYTSPYGELRREESLWRGIYELEL